MSQRQYRIGNLLMHGDTIVRVSATFKSHFNCETLDCVMRGCSAQENFTPIILTAELVGNIDMNHGYSIKKEYQTDEHYGFYKLHNEDDIYADHFLCYINSVDHLQNLYFYITGEEFPIKL